MVVPCTLIFTVTPWHVPKKKLTLRERIHIPPWEKEKHRLKSAFIGGDMLVTRRVYQIASVWWFCQKKGHTY